MLTVPSNQIPEHLAIRTSRRIECRLKWPFAARPERPACRKITDLGGTFDFESFNPFGSHVQSVYLRYVWFTDDDMKCLSPCTSLIFIDAGNTRITDRGASYLAEIKTLEYLFLWSTNVSDDLVDAIGNMSWLRMLDVSNTRVSQKAFDSLRRCFKNCLVSHSAYGKFYREFSGDAALCEWVDSDEPCDATEPGLQGFTNGKSTSPAR